MPALDYEFANHTRKLRLKADIAQGWDPHKRGMCYVRDRRFEFPMVLSEGRFDVNTRAQVSVFCRSDPWIPEPFIPKCEESDYGIEMFGTNARLTIEVSLFGSNDTLDRHLPWRLTDESNKPSLFWQIPFSVATSRPYMLAYDLQLLIVFSPPRNRPAPVEWDSGSGFFSGGLPTLGQNQ